MKKLIGLIAITACFLIGGSFNEAHAQVASSLLNSSSIAIDTVTNTASHTIYARAKGTQNAVTIQVDITKISGTLAGTLTPVVSNDGVTFYAIPVVNATPDAAYTVTDVASQGKVYTMPAGYLYYGAKWAGTGTMSGSFKGKLLVVPLH